MIFGKKDTKKCEECGSKVNKSFSYCPYCGNTFLDLKKEREDFGFLGRDDNIGEMNAFPQSLGITDKLINSIFNNMMKNLDKQFRNQFRESGNDFGDAEVRAFPNGIRIKVSGPYDVKPKKKPKRIQTSVNRVVREEQLKKMNSLPRAKARTCVKRVGNKVVYELSTPGLESTEDVFVSKLESGYEIKAIGSKKVYVNSVPINLPLKRYLISDNKLFVEFNTPG